MSQTKESLDTGYEHGWPVKKPIEYESTKDAAAPAEGPSPQQFAVKLRFMHQNVSGRIVVQGEEALSPLDRFADLARRLVRVPKEKLDAERERDTQERRASDERQYASLHARAGALEPRHGKETTEEIAERDALAEHLSETQVQSIVTSDQDDG